MEVKRYYNPLSHSDAQETTSRGADTRSVARKQQLGSTTATGSLETEDPAAQEAEKRRLGAEGLKQQAAAAKAAKLAQAAELKKREVAAKEADKKRLEAAVLNARPLAKMQIRRNIQELILGPNLFTNYRNIAAPPDFYEKPSPMSLSRRLMDNMMCLEEFFESFQRDYLLTLKNVTHAEFKLPPIQEGEL